MSLVCDITIGFLDTTDYWHTGVLRPCKPLGTEQVHRLQIACDKLFDTELRLVDYLEDDGLLRIRSLVVSRALFRIACLAHELFGMSAFDEAHHCPVYPVGDWEVPTVESLIEQRRRYLLDTDEEQRRENAEAEHRRMTSRKEFERETRERVGSFAKEWRYLV